MAHPKLGSVELQIDGASRHLVQAKDVAVSIYTRRTRGFRQGEIRNGVEYRRLGILHGHRLITPFQDWLFPRPNWPLFASPFYYSSFFVQVAAELHRRKPDVVHIHNFSQFVPLAKSASPRSRLVIHMHNDWLTQFDGRFIRKRLRHASAIVGCSQSVITPLIRKFPEVADRCFTIYNAIDTNEFQPSASPPPAKNVLYVGRISPEKGIHVLLEAFSEVLKTVPDARLDLFGSDLFQGRRMMIDFSDDPLTRQLAAFGDSGYRAELERRLSPEVARRVRFHGPVPHSELIEQYRTARMVVLPSVGFESFGIPAAEAAASGVPIVVTRSGGLQEVVADGLTGYIVDRANSQQLSRAMVKLLLDDDVNASMRVEARKRAVELFSWDAARDRLLRLYRKLLGQDESQALSPQALSWKAS